MKRGVKFMYIEGKNAIRQAIIGGETINKILRERLKDYL